MGFPGGEDGAPDRERRDAELAQPVHLTRSSLRPERRTSCRALIVGSSTRPCRAKVPS
jgi:hypothetical protein